MKPGLKRLIAGILLLIVAVILPVGMAVQIFKLIESTPEARFEAPGSVEFHADEPGRYYLWHHFQTVYQGATYNDYTELPSGLEIEVKDGDGKELDLIGSGTMTSSGPNGAKRSIGYIDLQSPTSLSMEVRGEGPPMVFSISQFHLFKIMKSFFIGFAFTALLALIGIALFIWGIIRLCMAAEKSSPKAPPQVPSDAP